MTSRRRGVGLTPMETRRDVIVRTAVLADELGYEIFAVPEGWGLDSTRPLSAAGPNIAGSPSPRPRARHWTWNQGRPAAWRRRHTSHGIRRLTVPPTDVTAPQQPTIIGTGKTPATPPGRKHEPCQPRREADRKPSPRATPILARLRPYPAVRHGVGLCRSIYRCSQNGLF